MGGAECGINAYRVNELSLGLSTIGFTRLCAGRAKTNVGQLRPVCQALPAR